MSALRGGKVVILQPEQITAVVLAGGFGTRIRHLLRDLPKPMAPVLGRPFVEWLVRYLARQGVREVILSTGHLAESVEQHFRRQPVRGVTVRCVAEATPLGTAGGFLNATRAAEERPAAWLVLNGDSLALAPLRTMFEAVAGPEIDAAILGVAMKDAARYGTVAANESGELVSFNEKRPGAGIINAGVYVFSADAVASFPPTRPLSFETEVFPALLAAGRKLNVCVTEAAFLDIGTPESLPLAETFVHEHQDWFAAD